MGRIKQKAFTLIEVLVVIGIISIALPALFSVIYVLLQEQVKVIKLTEVKRQGDFILTTIENTVKSNAQSIYNSPTGGVKQCGSANTTYTSSDGSSFVFHDKYGNWFRYVNTNSKIASDSSVLSSPADLSSDKVFISHFSMSCSKDTTLSSPVVHVSFTICYTRQSSGKCDQNRPEETATMSYESYIKLRNE